MRSLPRPRKEAYELYWYFASERQNIFYKRVERQQKPWTNDRILREYKFCNVFRAADRVSQYLIKDVAYDTDLVSENDKLFQIIAFRVFSNIETWNNIKLILGRSPIIKDLESGAFEHALNHVKHSTGRLYTGAFILCANNAYGRKIKHLNHIELFKDMFLKKDFASNALQTKSLEKLYNLLHSYPLMGDFMSYQISIDLNYSELFSFSENEFTKAGPGALRGISKVFESIEGYKPEEIILLMVDRQQEEFERFGYNFEGLWGRDLHAIDCQGLFCEVDKYCREALPNIKSSRKRIKAKFTSNPSEIKYFFPPKWGLNKEVSNFYEVMHKNNTKHDRNVSGNQVVIF